MRNRVLRAFALTGAVALLAAGCRSEVKSSVGVDNETKTIKLGVLTPLSGPVAPAGQSATGGMQAYFEGVNAAGGIGRDLDPADRFKVELVLRDHQYTPDVSVQQYNAIKDQVLMFAQVVGTPNVVPLVPLASEDAILVSPASTSQLWLQQKYFVASGAPYASEYVNAAAYLESQGVTPKAGLIYQDDAYGAEATAALEFAAQKFGFEIVARAPFKVTDTDFSSQVSAMQQAGADHVFLAGLPNHTGPILGAAATLQYLPQFISPFPGYSGQLLGTPDEPSPLVPLLQEHFWLVTDRSCAATDTGPGCEGMVQMLADLAKYKPDLRLNQLFQFGYNQAQMVREILERAIADGDLTREGVVTALDGIDGLEQRGLGVTLNFGPECKDRIPQAAATIWQIDPAVPGTLKKLADMEDPAATEYDYCAPLS